MQLNVHTVLAADQERVAVVCSKITPHPCWAKDRGNTGETLGTSIRTRVGAMTSLHSYKPPKTLSGISSTSHMEFMERKGDGVTEGYVKGMCRIRLTESQTMLLMYI